MKNKGIRVSFITLIFNLVLAIGKLLAGFIGKSNAMIADGVHTISDVLSTIVVIVGLKISSKEADKNHQYGHERYELVFSKILSLFLIVTGLYIGSEGVENLRTGNIETPGRIALLAAIFSIISKEIMYRYTIRTAKEISSVSMEADAWHHRSDAFSSIGVFVGIMGARMGYKVLDPIAAIVVSIMVIKVGIDLYVKSIRGLVDEAADDKTVRTIEEVAMDVQGVKKIKSLKTRVFANKIYVDMDILVNGCIRVHEGHDIAEEVHNRVESEVLDVKHCMVHVEPDRECCS